MSEKEYLNIDEDRRFNKGYFYPKKSNLAKYWDLIKLKQRQQDQETETEEQRQGFE